MLLCSRVGIRPNAAGDTGRRRAFCRSVDEPRCPGDAWLRRRRQAADPGLVRPGFLGPVGRTAEGTPFRARRRGALAGRPGRCRQGRAVGRLAPIGHAETALGLPGRDCISASPASRRTGCAAGSRRTRAGRDRPTDPRQRRRTDGPGCRREPCRRQGEDQGQSRTGGNSPPPRRGDRIQPGLAATVGLAGRAPLGSDWATARACRLPGCNWKAIRWS